MSTKSSMKPYKTFKTVTLFILTLVIASISCDGWNVKILFKDGHEWKYTNVCSWFTQWMDCNKKHHPKPNEESYDNYIKGMYFMYDESSTDTWYDYAKVDYNAFATAYILHCSDKYRTIPNNPILWEEHWDTDDPHGDSLPTWRMCIQLSQDSIKEIWTK